MTPPEQDWSDSHVLGYAPMDHTHREFLEVVAAVQRSPDAGLMECFAALKAHLQMHFGQEDTWMRDTAFPAGDCHIDEHAAVMRSVHQVEVLLEQGDTAECRRLADELSSWFPGHATYLDSALSHWMCKLHYGGTPVVVRRRQYTGDSSKSTGSP